MSDLSQNTTKMRNLEHSAGEAGEAGMVPRAAAQTPPSTRAGGQDDGSYTNSLKIFVRCVSFMLLFPN